MARELYEEEKYLLSLLAYALDGGEGTQWYHTSSADMSVVLSLADKHAILPLLYEGLEQYSTLTPEQSKRVTQICRRSVNQFYRLLFLSSYLTRLLQKQGIPCAVLKGPAAAAAYPIPEARKSGDIDLLLADPSDLARARVILEEDGFPWNEEQLANHHVNFHNYEGIEIELHTMLAEYFEDRELNAFLHRLQIECSKHIHEKNIVGVLLPVPDAPFHAIFLVIHMLHHFLRAGFGLKLLADWATLWSAEMSRGEQGALESMLRESGLYGFAQAVTAVCIRFLRLSSVNVAFLHPEEVSDTVVQNLIIEILEAEEFGDEKSGRMVVVAGSGILPYLREFHHQMKVNHPKGSVYPVLWPVLWMVTLVIFLRNNKKVRGVSTKAVLQSARERSNLIRDLKLDQGVGKWK